MTEQNEANIKATQEMMRGIAAGIDDVLNQHRPEDNKIGFVLLTFPMNDVPLQDGDEPRVNYVSNGADREDIVLMFKELIAKFSGMPQQTGTA